MMEGIALKVSSRENLMYPMYGRSLTQLTVYVFKYNGKKHELKGTCVSSSSIYRLHT